MGFFSRQRGNDESVGPELARVSYLLPSLQRFRFFFPIILTVCETGPARKPEAMVPNFASSFAQPLASGALGFVRLRRI